MKASYLEQTIINKGHQAAHQFKLRLNKIIVTDQLYEEGRKIDAFGFCNIEKGDIYIRIHSYHAKPRMLSLETIRDTLAHELAHLVDPIHSRYHTHLIWGISFWLRINWDRD